jgi:hypothetical protein
MTFEAARSKGKTATIARRGTSARDGYMKCSDWQARMKDLLKDKGWTVEEKGREAEKPWYYPLLFPEDWNKDGKY